MFDRLTKKIEKSLHVLRGYGEISEINIAEVLKEIRRALVDADVNYNIAKEFVNNVRDKAIGQKVLTSLKPSQLIVKIVKDELTELMGSQNSQINLKENSIILIAGLQGSGKTTFTVKLANYLKNKNNKNPLVVACDVYRPAAIDQLDILASNVNIDVYKEQGNKNPIKIANNAIKFAKQNSKDCVIIDTAGRLSIDQDMMNEISQIHKSVNPTETLFVVDSMTGQDAVNTAKNFNDVLDFDGVVLTKLDGDTRGGAALSIKKTVDKPIKFVSIGEKIDQVQPFYPERMADRILGMGDVVSLVEKAQEHYSLEEAKEIKRKLAKNEFDLNDFLKQLKNIKKMGNVKDLVKMIPGTSKLNIDGGEDKQIVYIEAIISSMTLKERENYKILNIQRRNRIAKGSGVTLDKVNMVIKQFESIRKVMKAMKGNKSSIMNMLSGGNLGMNSIFDKR